MVAGTVAPDSSLCVRVDGVGDDTALAGIQRLVAEAEASKSKSRPWPTGPPRYSSTSPPGAATSFVVWTALGEGSGILRTVTVLVIACPHALGLAIPLVIACRLRSRPGAASS